MFKKGNIKLHQVFSLKYSSKYEYKKMTKTIKSFFKIEDQVTKKQLSIAREYLGYDSKINNVKLNLIFWKYFFINIGLIVKIYAAAIFRKRP